MDGDVRSRRASIDPKPSIMLCCRVLRAFGVGSVSAETLRRAKFDKPEAAWPVWQALHDLLVVSASPGFPAAASPSTRTAAARAEPSAAGISPVVLVSEYAADNAAALRAMWAQLLRAHPGPSSDGAEQGELPELVRGFVSLQLACKGYAAADAWAADSALAESVGSKELLVALGLSLSLSLSLFSSLFSLAVCVRARAHVCALL